VRSQKNESCCAVSPGAKKSLGYEEESHDSLAFSGREEKREKLLVCELSASEGKTSVVNLALVLVVFLAGNKPAKIPVSDRQWSLALLL